ncbi:cell division protein ZapD [Aquitalea magnusonii]|nr:cell division protein ZapD [Aquitalea magnusonii]
MRRWAAPLIPGGTCQFDLPSYHLWQQNRRKSGDATCGAGQHR